MNNQEIHGHRGARGVYPENSLMGFKESYRQGVRAFELDVVISKDNKVVVSHEPWMSAQYCLQTTGGFIKKEDEFMFNLYEMTHSEIMLYDCGTKAHPDFPKQLSVKCYKPLLNEVLSLFTVAEHQSIFWNIEIKSEVDLYNIFQPKPSEFVGLVLEDLNVFGELLNVMIQSFDISVLEDLNAQPISYPISYLIENRDAFEVNMRKLSFVPAYYNPENILVDRFLIEKVHAQAMKIIPWTVNEIEDAKRLFLMGVDGVITDYPVEMLIQLQEF